MIADPEDMLEAAITKRGFIWILLIGAGKNAYEPRISLKERSAAYGNPKRRISEIMSGHSLFWDLRFPHHQVT